MSADPLWEQIRHISELSGRFQLRSGLESDTYFDKYQFECLPERQSGVSLQGSIVCGGRQ